MFEILTPRCEIRPWLADADELDALRRWTMDTEMMRYVSGTVWSQDDRRRFLERQKRSLQAAGVCFGVARLLRGGEIVGVAGMAPLELVDDWQIGWWVDPHRQGQGLGSEFAEALIRHALNVAGRPRVLAVIDPDNIASRRVAEKAGMTYLRRVPSNTLETRWPDKDCVLYASS